MAKLKQWAIQRLDGTVTKLVTKGRKFSLNGGQFEKLDNYKAQDSEFAISYYDIPVGNGEMVRIRQPRFASGVEDVFYNGRDVLTGQAYEKIIFPKWAYAFVALYIANFLFIMGGALGGVAFAFGSCITFNICANSKNSTGKKVALSIGLYVLITVISFIVATALYGVISSIK